MGTFQLFPNAVQTFSNGDQAPCKRLPPATERLPRASKTAHTFPTSSLNAVTLAKGFQELPTRHRLALPADRAEFPM